MANYREILRLDSLGSSQRSIARELKSSRDTVAEAIKAAEAAGTKVVVITATHKHTIETPHPTIAGYGSLIPSLNEGSRLVLTRSGSTTSATAGA